MFLIDKLKGVFSKMIAPKTVENVLHITPVISSSMKDAIELWEEMYMGGGSWLNKNVHSLGLPASIASEKARTATIEMEIKVTGDSEKAKFIREQVEKLVPLVRNNLEYGVALGSLILKPYVVRTVDNKYKIEYDFTKATNFYPLSFSANGDIKECAFIDCIITKEDVFKKLEYHSLNGTTLTVRNFAFKSRALDNQPSQASMLSSELGEPIPLSTIPEWSELEAETVVDNVDTMLFGYFKMPQANCIDLNSPLGVSGFSRAVGLIRDADVQYSDLLWEFEGGQLAVDVDRTALLPTKDARGREIAPTLPQLQDRLYRRNLDLGDDNVYNVFSPDLRDQNIINGLNTILMRIEDVCDLSRGTLSEASYAEARTATELRILKQRSYSANCDIQKSLENALKQVVQTIDKYCDLYEIVPSGEYEVAYKWDDSIIVDKDAERQVDLLDINAGLLSKVEYRMKWMGETETQAQEAIQAIMGELEQTMAMQQTVIGQRQSLDNGSVGSNASYNQDSNNKSEAQAEHNKRTRANESQVTSDVNKK